MEKYVENLSWQNVKHCMIHADYSPSPDVTPTHEGRVKKRSRWRLKDNQQKKKQIILIFVYFSIIPFSSTPPPLLWYWHWHISTSLVPDSSLKCSVHSCLSAPGLDFPNLLADLNSLLFILMPVIYHCLCHEFGSIISFFFCLFRFDNCLITTKVSWPRFLWDHVARDS